MKDVSKTSRTLSQFSDVLIIRVWYDVNASVGNFLEIQSPVCHKSRVLQ